MENTGLIEFLNQAAKQQELTADLEELTRSTKFIKPLRVYGGETKACKTGLVPINTFGIYHSREKIECLGPEVEALVIARRRRASIIMGDIPLSWYHAGTAEYEDVKRRALAKEKNYLAGLEFLLWLPASSQFVLFFCGNPTLRNEAAKINSQLGQHITLKVKIIVKEHVWAGVDVLKCTIPDNTLPSQEEFAEVLDQFNNPIDSNVKTLEEGAGAKRAR